MTQFVFDAIGTSWTIDIYETLTTERESEILTLITERIDIFDKNYSRFRTDSLVTEMSQKTGTYTLPDDAKQLFDLYVDLYKKTNGLFTPLIGQMISDAGYDATYSLEQKTELMIPPSWDEAVEYSFPTLTIKTPVLIDVGAAGKGYLIDIVGNLLESQSIHAYCIDAGGDILHKGMEPIRIGLENSFNTNQVVGVYSLQNASICGSSGARRAWGTYTHIFNPLTKQSATKIAAVWVAAKDALVADALATCLFLVSPETLLDAYEFEYLVITSDGSYHKSAHFSDEIFAAQ